MSGSAPGGARGSGDAAPRLILASASPRRLEILRQLGLAPEVRPAEIDESWPGDEPPDHHVERLAREKAARVAAAEPGALVLAGDTIVLRQGTVLGKPASAADAERMLSSLSGSEHEVLSALAVASGGAVLSGACRTRVRFRRFDAEDVRAYVATGEPMDKAGAYGIQGMGATLVESIDGDYYSVVGLPVGLLVELLGRAGWRYAFGRLERAAEST